MVPKESFDTNSFTYLVTPKLKLSNDLMIYARIASGFRAGGSNLFNPDPNIQRSYDPDETHNFEVGAKGDLIDKLLSFDLSLYYIDWKNLQVTLVDPTNNLTYTSNAGKARSDGVELSLGSKPSSGLSLAATAVFDDAVLKQDFPSNTSAYGIAGDRLPFASRFSGSLSADQGFPLSANIVGHVGGTFSYVGDRIGTFAPTSDRQRYPSYTKFDVRAGAEFDTWKLDLYVNNVTDQRGLLGGGIGTFPPNAFTYIRPRTIGMSLNKDF